VAQVDDALDLGDGRRAKATVITERRALSRKCNPLSRLHLLGGLRLAYLETIYDSKGYIRRDTLRDTRLLPRFGAVYDLTD
jgi:hypothetical protein